MKLVFFDIECASVHKYSAKICAFGYVVCDEQFNIIKKEDILINPRGKFELTDRKGERGIVLPYEYGEFKNYPPFKEVYPKIKSLLEDADSVVLGHAVLNDVKYLNLETKRFKLPSFKFSFADTQLIFMTSINDFSKQLGLEHIAEQLGVEFTPHRAADDAYATMKIMEAMCKARGCGYHELRKSLGFTNGKIENYYITRPQSRANKRYVAEKRNARAARSKAREKFYNNLARKKLRADGALGGKAICFSRNIEDEISLSIPLVNKIYESGGKYTKNVEECAYFVRRADDSTERSKKADRCEKQVLSPEELRRMLDD